jgi:hypothetical protein
MQIPTSGSPTWRSRHPHYVALTLGEATLAVPQAEVHTLESMLDLEPDADGLRVGWIRLHGRRWPVFCASPSLEPMASLPDGRRICVMLSAASGLFGFACDAVSSVDAAHLDLVTLPACMARPGHPVSALARSGDEVLCVTCAEDLLDFALRARPETDESEVRRTAPSRELQ